MTEGFATRKMGNLAVEGSKWGIMHGNNFRASVEAEVRPGVAAIARRFNT
jgi:hypothetical protein